MDQESESARQLEKASASGTSGTPDDTTVSRAKPDDAMIDFHSPEFNRVDELNDWGGNYQSFRSLDGIVTAHERHQVEFRRGRNALDLPREEPVRPRKNEEENDDIEILDPPASLTVISEGRTLILDTEAERAIGCAKTLHGHRLSCTLMITGSPLPSASVSGPRRFKILPVDRVSVSGAFGGFSARATAGGSEKPLAEWLDDAATFDLVLDLQPVPSFAGGRLPVGYYAPGPSPAALEEALAELPEMRGRFKKPQFVIFNESRCFHGRSRVHDCRRCLEICPVHAIQPVDRGITINHYLCQGCGGCALVCPADAFRVVQPSQKELLGSLRNILAGPLASGVSPIRLVISDCSSTSGNRSRANDAPGREIRFEVEQIAFLRLEVLLTALAYGAAEILVECGPKNPSNIGEAVEWQVQMARTILRGLGLEEERIRFLVVSPEDIKFTETAPLTASMGKKAIEAPTALAIFSPGSEGRALIRLAAQYIQDQSGAQKPWLPLPTGSPFGAVAVNPRACTLCMACAAACPSGALFSDGKAPRLTFRETRCHQCGLCREKCPEGAIRLLPRLLLGHGAAEGQTVLLETEPFRCVECGVAFAPPSMIERMKQKLAGHWMYAGERQMRRLQMCRTCRTRDALTSGEEGSWKL